MRPQYVAVKMNEGRRVFKLLQRTPKSAPQPPPGDTATAAATQSSAGSTREESSVEPDVEAPLEPGALFTGKTSASFAPTTAIFGLDDARSVTAMIGGSKPRALFFAAAPRTASHATAVRALLEEQAEILPVSDAVAIVSSFDDRRPLTMLRLPAPDAEALANGVAEAIEMLSVTLPAAFDSDSYKVARIALDEELRSGHDTAIDNLKRRAESHNIGLLRTPLGYAIAPMHEGRVVAPGVFQALPDTLKAGVEAKLTAFEEELAGVLDNRTALQQDFRTRLRDLDTEVSSLTVTAALANLVARYAANVQVKTWLSELSRDLTRNAALFLSAAAKGGGHVRAPVEIAHDPALARYRVHVLSPEADGPAVYTPASLERTSLCGLAHLPAPGVALTPFALLPGVLARAGHGLVVLDARALMAEFGAWPLIVQACKTGAAQPADAASPIARPAGIAVPFDARIVLTGDLDDYQALCRSDAEGSRSLRLIEVFDDTMPRDTAAERAFAAYVSGIVTSENLQPVDGSAIEALLDSRTTDVGGARHVSTDCDCLRDILLLANHHARAHARMTTTKEDIESALKRRARRTESGPPAQQGPSS